MPSLRDNNAFQVIEVVTVVPGWYFNGVFTLEEVRRVGVEEVDR